MSYSSRIADSLLTPHASYQHSAFRGTPYTTDEKISQLHKGIERSLDSLSSTPCQNDPLIHELKAWLRPTYPLTSETQQVICERIQSIFLSHHDVNQWLMPSFTLTIERIPFCEENILFPVLEAFFTRLKTLLPERSFGRAELSQSFSKLLAMDPNIPQKKLLRSTLDRVFDFLTPHFPTLSPPQHREWLSLSIQRQFPALAWRYLNRLPPDGIPANRLLLLAICSLPSQPDPENIPHWQQLICKILELNIEFTTLVQAIHKLFVRSLVQEKNCDPIPQILQILYKELKDQIQDSPSEELPEEAIISLHPLCNTILRVDRAGSGAPLLFLLWQLHKKNGFFTPSGLHCFQAYLKQQGYTGH